MKENCPIIFVIFSELYELSDYIDDSLCIKIFNCVENSEINSKFLHLKILKILQRNDGFRLQLRTVFKINIFQTRLTVFIHEMFHRLSTERILYVKYVREQYQTYFEIYFLKSIIYLALSPRVNRKVFKLASIVKYSSKEILQMLG